MTADCCKGMLRSQENMVYLLAQALLVPTLNVDANVLVTLNKVCSAT